MKCQCPLHGYCETHQRMMSEIKHRQCREEQGYYEAFQLDLKRNGAMNSRGLGDTVKKFTDATGLSQLAELYKKITGKDCGCDDRRQRWNTWFRYKQFMAVGVTTAPRGSVYLQSTVHSIIQNHVEPIVFAEPGSNLTGLEKLEITKHSERQGAWRNWVKLCQYLLQHTRSDYVLTVQDDTVLVPGSIEFLKSVQWPKSCGMVSLYTPTHYSRKKAGLHKIVLPPKETLWGACAMMFRRDDLRRLLATKVARNWRGADFRTRVRPREPWEIANVDTAIGKALTELGLYPYFFTPSLSQHIGVASSIGHKGMGPKRTAKDVVKDFSVFRTSGTGVE